jgi:hypothetical protein
MLADEAGFTDINVRFESRTARYSDIREFLTGYTLASPGAVQFKAFPEEMQNRFVAYLVERLDSYLDDGGLAIPRENHFLLASRS